MNIDETKVRYEGVLEDSNKIKEIASSNLEIGKEFAKIISGFKNDKVLSSKVFTPSMEKMLNEIENINNEFYDIAISYTEFLDKQVAAGYQQTDIDMEKIWNNK